MPTYTLQGPDGKIYDVQGPEGATADQLGAFIMQNMSNAPVSSASDSGSAQAHGQPGIMASLGASLGHGAGEVALGAQQAVGHGLQWLGLNDAGNLLMNDAKQGLDRIDAQYAPYQKANPTTAAIGNAAGNVVSALAGGELAAIPKLGATAGAVAGLVPKIGRFLAPLANGAAQGAVYGGAAPVRDGDYADQAATNASLGAYLGGGASSVLAAAPSIARNVRGAIAPLVNPQKYVGQGLAGSLGDDAQSVLNSIDSAKTFVPGSQPTTAQVGAHPVLVATEKAAGNTGPFRVAQALRENANNEARWQALVDVAKTPDDLNAAIGARSEAVQPLYDAAHSQTTNVGRGFIDFARRPAVTQAMQMADELARNEGVTLKWPTPDDRAISGQALDYTRRALGDMIGSAQSSNNKQLARALTDSKDYLTSWADRYIPDMQAASQKYAEMSVPVNTMEAGQQIMGGLGNKAMNSSGIPSMTLTGYKSALVRALKNQPFGIDPQAHQVLQNIGQDLQRASISNSLRSPGSDTAYNLNADGWLARNLYGKNFGGATNLGRTGAAIGAGLGTAMTGHPWLGIGAAGGVLKGAGKVGEMVGTRLQSALADLLLNPQMLRPYLQDQVMAASAPQNLKAQALARALQGNVVPAVAVGGPALLNQ